MRVLIDSYESAWGENLLRLGRDRHSGAGRARRLLVTEAGAAVIFVLGAGALAAFGHSTRSLSLWVLAVMVGAYLIASRVQYPVGSAWTAPTQLVFVPMLFVLPTTWVPVIVAACSVADRLPQAVRGPVAPARLLARVGDSFYALGPALVLVAFGGQTFAWERWPLFLLAFAAQVAFDGASGVGRTWVAERVPPSVQLPMLWLYSTDASLSCIGLLAAASAVQHVELVLLVLPLVGLQGLLARERQQRLDASLALREEHRIAVELQRGLLPKRLPEIPGLELAAHYEAAGRGTEAGGDWYDAFALTHGRVGVVVGDVTGRGIAAASTMGHLRSVTHAFALADNATRSPGEVLTRLNRYQLALAEQELFTVIYAIVDPRRGRVSWASGGHPPPLVRSSNGATRFLQGGGAVMGVWDVVYADAEDIVAPSDTLILYSDGLVERPGEPLDTGLERLSAAAAAGPDQPSELCAHVLGTMLPVALAVRDDVTAMVVRVRDDALHAVVDDGGRARSYGVV
ncbi:MAG TPA: PP2C family protein-serine/threonine phosphatase [Solirubrobacteraceae bacterium]